MINARALLTLVHSCVHSAARKPNIAVHMVKSGDIRLVVIAGLCNTGRVCLVHCAGYEPG